MTYFKTPNPPIPTWPLPQSMPYAGGCNHTFSFNMVIPPQGAYISCPICGAQRFVHGTQITC